jgi:hypothetical protein
VSFRIFWICLLAFLLAACGPTASSTIPVNELPDPAIYALTGKELPDVGLPWQQTYNLTTAEQGYKWAYLAYQAYQSSSPGSELESAFAVNNDVVLYTADVSHDALPQPPDSLGDLQGISWKPVAQANQLGDKSALWKTTIGQMMTPVWWLEFYQGHAYVRLSLFGFPDQIAPAIIYGLGDIISSRLPTTNETLRSDAATQVATQPPPPPTAAPQASPTPGEVPSTEVAPTHAPQETLTPLSYTAPPGETGMVAYIDETGAQLVDGVLGTDDILADLGNGTAYEWVGWTDLTEPVTLTFSLAGEVDIASVEIGIYHRDGLGIFVPESVTINGVSYDLGPDDVPNNQRKDLAFSGPFNGPEVQVVLHHRGRGWIMVDEVRFIQAK